MSNKKKKTIPLDVWDNFHITSEERSDPAKAVVDRLPGWASHDYIVYTDGAGGQNGIGSYAAVVHKLSSTHVGTIEPSERNLVFGANFGQSVLRNELTAFIEGTYTAIRMHLEDAFASGELSPNKHVIDNYAYLHGPNRLRILWYTDRKDLATSLLYDEDDNTLYARNACRDLWMRWSAFAQCCVVTPRYIPRNSVEGQESADALCTLLRKGLKSTLHSGFIYNAWKNPKVSVGGEGNFKTHKQPQKAIL